MKILHVLSQLLGKTGSGVYVENIIRELHMLGHEQWIIMGVDQDHKDEYDHYEIEAHIIPVIFEKLYGMSDVMPYDTLKFSDMDEDLFLEYTEKFKCFAKKTIIDVKPDVVISNHLWLATYAVSEAIESLGKIPGFKVPEFSAISHGTDIRQMSLAGKFSEYVVKGVERVGKVFSLYESQNAEICRIFRISNIKKVETVGIACNADIFHNCDVPCENVGGRINLIYAGKISFSKGLRELIETFEMLEKGKYRLYIAGTGSGEEFVKLLDMMQSSKEDIVYLGMLSQVELAENMRKSHVFIMPSYYEGMPLVINEALLCDCKIVASRLPGVEQLVGMIENDEDVCLVDLPLMEGIDSPWEGQLCCYKQRIKAAVENVTRGLDRYNTICRVGNISRLHMKSWGDIAKKLIESPLNADTLKRIMVQKNAAYSKK